MQKPILWHTHALRAAHILGMMQAEISEMRSLFAAHQDTAASQVVSPVGQVAKCTTTVCTGQLRFIHALTCTA